MGLQIYSSTIDMPRAAALGEVLAAVPADRVCGVVVCGTSEEVEYHDLLGQVKAVVYRELGRRVPVTLIPQRLLPTGGLAVEIYALDGDEAIRFGEHEGVCYGIAEGGEMLFVEGIPAADFAASVAQQSGEVFAKLDALLAKHGFAVDDIVRQWNYIGSIVSYKGSKQNYQEFNDARSAYYAKGQWQNGYPAATGIGAEGEGIIVGGIAFKCEGCIFPIDNPLQVAAHVYSKRVLVDDDANAVKSTPKFERAKLIERAGGACCFVSGTAAIRGEESVDASSAAMQTVRTIENIEHLVSKENLVRFGCKPYELKYVRLHVFVKEAKDYDAVREVVEKAYPHIPVVYSIADVCRQELLVEIEGILIA